MSKSTTSRREFVRSLLRGLALAGLVALGGLLAWRSRITAACPPGGVCANCPAYGACVSPKKRRSP